MPEDAMRLVTQQILMDKGSPMVIRSRLRAVSLRMGFHEVQRERMQIAASELMSNQMKFATGAGLFQVWEHPPPEPALDLFALDFGPGIVDLHRALDDGYSTARTLGRGLGSIARAADLFDIYTQPENSRQRHWCGTAAWARFHAPATAPSRPKGIRTGCFLRALGDDLFNGDTLRAQGNTRFFNWIHLDGLGHGKNAAETGESLHGLPSPGADPPELLRMLNQRLYGSRGAMGLAVRLDIETRNVVYAGVGDLTLRHIGSAGGTQPRFPGGVLGRGAGPPGTGSFDLKKGDLICSFSDGIVLHPDMEDFPGLKNRHPQLIALLMGHVLGRSHDDQSLFIVHFQDTDPQAPRSFP